MIHNEEIEGQDGKSPSLADAIHAFKCLWNLKYGTSDEAKKYSSFLQNLRDWRNESSHNAPITSEQEIDAALQIVVAMYLYVTGMNIEKLEAAGYDAEQKDVSEMPSYPYRYKKIKNESLMVAEDIFIYGSIPVDLPNTKREELAGGKLDLILMYAIGSGARNKTEAAGKIALGIKEILLKEEQMAAYKSLKYLLFHYWKNPQAYVLSKEPALVNKDAVPSDYLLRMEKDAVKFLLLDYNPQQPVNLDRIDILKTQRRGNIRYLPFVTTMESITLENNVNC